MMKNTFSQALAIWAEPTALNLFGFPNPRTGATIFIEPTALIASVFLLQTIKIVTH